MKLSATKISTFAECPYRYKAIYIDKRSGEVKSNDMAVGEGIHAFIEYFSLKPDSSLEELENIYKRTALAAKSLEDPSFVDKYLKVVKFYYESGKRLTPLALEFKKPCTEEWFNIYVEDVEVIGKIDIITSGYSVVDYKTASRLFDTKDATYILRDKGFQLSLYALAFYQRFRKLPNKVGFQVILKDCSTIQNVIATRTMEDLEAVKKYIVNIANKIKATDEFKPNYGCNDCKWCDFKKECSQL